MTSFYRIPCSETCACLLFGLASGTLEGVQTTQGSWEERALSPRWITVISSCPGFYSRGSLVSGAVGDAVSVRVLRRHLHGSK